MNSFHQSQDIKWMDRLENKGQLRDPGDLSQP